MSVETRKADSLIMKLVVKKLQKRYSTVDFGNMDMEGLMRARRLLCGDGSIRNSRRGVLTKKKLFGGVPVEVTSSLHGKTGDTIVYIHGGAFVLGIFPHHRKYAEALALETGCTVVMVDYSLSPEHKFPKALNECEAVYNHVKKLAPQGRIILAGDSAGGGLSLSLAMRLHKKNSEPPLCLILHSPFTDLSGSLDRSINEDINTDFIIRKGLKGTVNEVYTGSADPSSWEVSPYWGDYSVLPPVFITCDPRETLYADSLDIETRLERCGRTVRMIALEGTFHTAGTLGTLTPETKRITGEIAGFICESGSAAK